MTMIGPDSTRLLSSAFRLAAAILLMASSALAQQKPLPSNAPDVPDPDPEIERKSFQVAEGFEVNLFASDPVLAKPIHMNFDPAGRLWVATSETYPQIAPGGTADDKIVVLDDRDGDGKADKTEVFAGGLLIPTGIAPGDGGAYVANSTELIHLKDTDGDGKADARRTVLSGFGTEDTHHLLHTLQWGPEGLLYLAQSIYIHSHIETPHGVRRLGGGGFWQFRPETMRLEVFSRGLVNPWGLAFDAFGQTFATDGAGGEGINFLVPGASYVTDPTAIRVVKGLNPGSPKDCGLERVEGRSFPDDWQGNLVTNDFRGNRVCRYVLSDDNSGFASRELPELIKTTHRAFRPIDVKLGPDGALYIADWYNPIIQHGEVDFRDPRRDHTHGRIWRVAAKNRPAVGRPKLVGATVEQLLDELKSPESWTRQQAKRVLKERGPKAVLPALTAWTDRLKPGELHPRLEALWTYQTIDEARPDLLEQLLTVEDFRVRAAAVRVIGHWRDRLRDPQGLLASRVVDDNPRVRLEAVRVLAEIPSVRSVELALKAIEKPVDPYLDYAIWLTCRQLKSSWLPEVEAGRTDLGGVNHLVWALTSIESPAVVGHLLRSIREGKVTGPQEVEAIAQVTARGNPEELGALLDLALAPATPPARRAALIGALMRATGPRKIKPAGDLVRLGALLLEGEDAVRVEAARAGGLWKVENLRKTFLELARGQATSESLRRAALDAIADLGGPESRQALIELTGPDQPETTRRLAASALAGVDVHAAAAAAVPLLAAGGDPADVYRAFLRQKEGPNALAQALSGRELPADAAKVGLRLVRGSGLSVPTLTEGLTKAGKLDAAKPEMTAEERSALVAEVARSGDPARGEAIFREASLNCLGCHAIGGAGGQVGPDLSSLGGSAPVDYVFDSILTPDKAVKEGYHSVVVATDDGRVLTGIKIGQSPTSLVLRDPDGAEQTIPIASIEEQKPGGSLMPPGLADTLTHAEFVDLVRFLSELGKVGGSYTVGKERLARRWLVPDPATFKGPSSLASASWKPVYSRVSGVLPKESRSSLPFARFEVDVTTPGKVKLALDGARWSRLQVYDRTISPGEDLVLDLPTGRHTFQLTLRPMQENEGLRAELLDVPGSSAQARMVLGK